MPPPAHIPRPQRPAPKHWPRTLDLYFAADPFDPRFVTGEIIRERRLTSLGIVVNSWWWWKTHQAECGPAFGPIAGAMEQHLRRECPDVVEELSRIEQSPDRST